MDKFLDMLGYKYRDKMTGLEGYVDSICFDLYGCVQVSMRSADKPFDDKGEISKGYWFDISRVEKVDGERILEVPLFSKFSPEARRAPPGPADKPTRKA